MAKTLYQIEGPVPLAEASRILGVPPKWLRSEIIAGRLPGVQADKTCLVHVPTIARILENHARRVLPYTKDDVTPEDMDAINGAMIAADEMLGATVDARAIVAAAWNLRRELDKAATISA